MTRKIFGTALIEYLPALGFLLFTLIYLILAYSYEADARAFPAGVAWVMLALTLFDLVSRSRTGVGIALLQILNPAAETEGSARGVAVDPKRQIFAILWIFGFAILLYLIGILYAVPIYVFVVMRFRSELSYVLSIGVATLTTLAIWLLFGLALQINFYQGVFFEF